MEYKQWVTKNDPSDRTFIENKNTRYLKVQNAFSLEVKVEDRKIILIDDSIVRGTVMKYIIRELKKCGAREIHIRIPCPKIINKCDYRINISSKD